MTISVKGPDGSNFSFPDGTPEGEITGAMSKHYGDAPAAEPVTTNKVARAAATGVPIIGGALNQLDAATNAALAPVLNPLFDEKDQLKGATFAERRRESLRQQNEMDRSFSEAHPVIDTAAKVAGGVAGSIPAMTAAPAAFGLTGTLPQMVTRGAASNAAVGAADALVRGESPAAGAAVGGVVGAAAPLVARGVGQLARSIKEWRNPTPPAAQNVEKVAGVDIPMHQTLDPAIEARKEIMRRGAAGGDAEKIALQADDEARHAIEQASGNIGRSLDPAASGDHYIIHNPITATVPQRVQFLRRGDSTAIMLPDRGIIDVTNMAKMGMSDEEMIARSLGNHLDSNLPDLSQVKRVEPSARTAPQAAGEVVQSELAAQAAAREAAAQQQALRVAAEGDSLARGIGGGAAPVSALDAGEGVGAAVAARRASAIERTKAAYKARDTVEGTFDESVPRGLAEDIRTRLNSGENPIWVDPTNASTANRALKLIDQTLGRDSGVFENAAGPKPAPGSAPSRAAAPATEDETVSALRAKFGDTVADAYARQHAPSDILPRDLAGAKPRYNIGQDQYEPKFASDIDKAMFIAAQSNKSARDAEFRTWLKGNGYTDAEISRHGQAVRDAIKQQARGSEPGAVHIARTTPPAGAAEQQSLSLLEFIASKGGLAPHAELDAIGLGHGSRSQIPGRSGFFGTVRKNGDQIDRMREAAEEAGYLRGAHGETSTPTQFLDAIDAELRGQKLYPEGHAGFTNKREAAARGVREQSELDSVMRGHERDLEDAGYGGLGPDVRKRATALMHDEGMSADDAVDHAMRHLEQEDAALAGVHGFPGDAPMGAPAAAAPRSVDLKAMDEARKRLVTMYGDAKSAAIRSGDKSDMRAMGKILTEFDNSIGDALASGKFSGDAALAKELQDAARRSHAEYRQTFSSRGPGDEIGRNVEKILGRYSDTAATPEEIAKMSYGPKSSPGTGAVVKTALRLQKILGENSPEWGQYKSGLFAYVDDANLSPAKRAARIDSFLNTSLAKGALAAEDRAGMSRYANSLRVTEPRGAPLNEVEKAVARIAGTDGHLPASPTEVADMLFSRSGKGDKGMSVRLALRLKNDLKPESWSAVRQGMWEKLTNAGEGKIEFGPQALSQRLHEFLNESGKPLARVLFSKAEREEMAKLASVYKRMTPLKGTTNPSGTAPMLAKIAKKASNNILALIGLGAHGVSGAIVGHAIQRGAEGLKDARAGKEAVRLFFGPQARRPVVSSRLPQLIGAPAVEASQR